MANESRFIDGVVGDFYFSIYGVGVKSIKDLSGAERVEALVHAGIG